MKINIQKGNLFDLDKRYALAHCVSLDCSNPKSWGMGIATEFKKRFKGMKHYCARVIENNSLSHPVVIPYCENDRCIFNLITKRVYYGKPTYATITKCIHDMASMCKQFDIKYLGIYKLGCNLDKLQWGKVKEIIEQEFKNIDIEIEVRYL